MPVRSFKLRIALLVMIVTGLILGVFASASWAYLKRVTHERLDVQLMTLGHRILPMLHDQRSWGRLERGLEFLFNKSRRDGPMMMLAFNGKREVLYQSPDWPAFLPADEFPLPGTGRLGGRPHPQDGLFDRPNPFQPDRRRHGPGPNRPRGAEQLAQLQPAWRTVRWEEQDWRLATFPGPGITLVLARSLDEVQADIRRLRRAVSSTFLLALLSIAGGGWFVASRALRPVRQLTEAAEGITAAGLDQRIDDPQADKEFARLIDVFNAMLARLERSFQQATRFSADAAHELKTPLTILQGELEQGLQSASSGSKEQQRYQQLLDETQRLKTIVRKLLLLSLADAGQLSAKVGPYSIREAVQDLAEDAEALAPHLTVTSHITTNAMTRADSDLMPHVWNNLLQNAIKYNRDGGSIMMSLTQQGDSAVFHITNTGSEIPETDRDKVFERFFRSDEAHSRTVDGTGLGLSLAREIVRAHGGKLNLLSGAQDNVCFELTLPLDSATSPAG